MPDREKVIKGLEYCSIGECAGKECPYYHDVMKDAITGCDCTTELAREALALLKEQPEIVRCKDCVYHENEKARSNQTAWLPCMEMQTKNNWYCADGVKKDE